MMGLMQDRPLLVSSLVEHARKYHGGVEIVTSSAAEQTHRSNYATVITRAAQLAHALQKTGISHGCRVGTLAWNNHRHLELYYAVPGMGAVLHTINPRLFPEQISYIINHAQDQVLFVEPDFLPLLGKIRTELTSLKGLVVLCDEQEIANISFEPPPGGDVVCYEAFIKGEAQQFAWPEFDENTAACLCYTSGTTGHPKGVLYSHRSIVLHSFAASLKDCLDIGHADTVMPVVPMFHVNAWGIPYIGAMLGFKMVLPHSNMSGENLYRLIRDEGCTLSLGVPTIWQALMNHMATSDIAQQEAARLPIHTFVIGGAAVSEKLLTDLEETFDANVLHVWGMTEMSPLGTANRGPVQNFDADVRFKLKQGRAPYGVDMKILGEDGGTLPWDGVARGRLLVRGPWIARQYYGHDTSNFLDAAGYFDTGDIATMDPNGVVTIVDRAKDVIKSGGEWISSMDLENIALGHPDIAAAAVIAVPHHKWQERPLLICVAAQDSAPDKADVLQFMENKIARWWLPDDVIFVDRLPYNATGKVHKMRLREQFKDYRLPPAQNGP